MEARQQNFMYDERLSPMARIYLAEISKYFGTPVDCLDDNLYFATLFKTTDRQIRNWKNELKSFGYLEQKKSNNRKTLEYIPDLENHKTPCEEMTVIFKTTEGKLLTSPIEAIMYFDEVIDQDTTLGKTANALRIVSHVLANSLFDERYYNICLAGFIVNYEFLQYVVEHFRTDVMFSTAQKILRNYTKIKNLNLYVLTAIVNLFKEEFEIARTIPDYIQGREKFRKEAEEYQLLRKGARNE